MNQFLMLKLLDVQIVGCYRQPIGFFTLFINKIELQYLIFRKTFKYFL